MSFPFMNAGISILGKSPKAEYTDDFQQLVNEEFSNSSNVFTIEEETSFASGVFQNVDVRISSLINPTTGSNVEYDFKKISFQNISKEVSLGWLYKFDNNYWITVNVDKSKSLAQTAILKRCNNMLRWVEELTGAYYSVPCSLGYLINENRDYATAGSAIVTPSGMINCIVQHNSKTDMIMPNQRFLFGNPSNWTAYRVEGGGINNFNNQQTEVNTNSGFITLSLAVDYVNKETDDLINGIANDLTNVYTLTLNETTISGGVSQTVQLNGVVTLNSDVVSRTLTWSTSDNQVATVSTGGLVTFTGIGSATISCQLENNSTVVDTCTVSVVGAPVDTYQVVISPDTNYVLEGTTKTWTTYLYKNTVLQGDTFTFALNASTVPSDNYTYTVIDGNSFSVANVEMFLSDTLEVTATSGIYSGVVTILLKGAW